jgi:hypothetical protein
MHIEQDITIIYLPIVNLSKLKKGAYKSSVNVFKHLPQYIKAFTTIGNVLNPH